VKSQSWGNPSSAYLQVSSVDFNGGGPQISVGPGDSITGTVSYQFWDNGNPTAVWQIWALLGYGNPTACLWSGVPGGQPGVSRTDSWTFAAPDQPGTYSVLIMPIALYGCADLASNPEQNWPSEVPVGQITVSSPTTVQTCSGGQYWDGSECVCPSGQQWNGQECVAPTPTCSGGQYWNGSACVCPSGQEWNGYQCVTPQQAQVQVRVVDVLGEQANSFTDLLSLMAEKVTPTDVIVWTYDLSNPPNIESVSLNGIPDYLFVQIYSNHYDNPSRWAFEYKSPVLKDLIGDILLFVAVEGFCILSGITPPPVDAVSASVCFAAKQTQEVFDIADNIQALMQVVSAVSPVVSISSLSVQYNDGSSATLDSSQIISDNLNFPTLFDTINTVAAKQKSAQIVSVHSPVYLLIQDSSGERLGEDANGQVFNEIPNSYFLETNQLAYLPADLAGYNVQLTGTSSGNYGLTITYMSGSSTQQTVEGSISQGQIVNYDVSSTSQSVSITTAQPKWSWTNFGLTAVVTIVLVLVASEAVLRRRRRGGSYPKKRIRSISSSSTRDYRF
jgi:hypothetical protein